MLQIICGLYHLSQKVMKCDVDVGKKLKNFMFVNNTKINFIQVLHLFWFRRYLKTCGGKLFFICWICVLYYFRDFCNYQEIFSETFHFDVPHINVIFKKMNTIWISQCHLSLNSGSLVIDKRKQFTEIINFLFSFTVLHYSSRENYSFLVDF